MLVIKIELTRAYKKKKIPNEQYELLLVRVIENIKVQSWGVAHPR